MINCIENKIENQINSATFLIEPLDIGQGLTVGNTLRRSMLSDISGTSITRIRINNLNSEFNSISGVREDVIEVLLNLKNVIIKDYFLFKNQYRLQKGFLNVKGPCIVTAGMFYLPNTGIKIINPDQYVCTIIDDSLLYLEIDIENGKGYRLTSSVLKDKINHNFDFLDFYTLELDTLFTPVRKVNFKIRLINDNYGNLKESLLLHITTNGSMTPKRVLFESLKNTLFLFSSIFLNSKFNSISSILI